MNIFLLFRLFGLPFRTIIEKFPLFVFGIMGFFLGLAACSISTTVGTIIALTGFFVASYDLSFGENNQLLRK